MGGHGRHARRNVYVHGGSPNGGSRHAKDYGFGRFSGRRAQDHNGHAHGGPNTLGAGGDRAANFGFGRVASVDRNQGRFYRGLAEADFGDNDVGSFARTEPDVAIDAPTGQ